MTDLTKGQKAYAARNARAQAQGFRNYWAQRQAAKHGLIVYDKLNGEYVPATRPIKKGTSERDPKWKRDGFDSFEDYNDFHRQNGPNSQRVKEIREWQKTQSHSPITFLTDAQIRDPDAVNNFYRTWVSKSREDKHNKSINIKEWIVDQMGYMTAAQYKAYKKARRDYA